MSIDGSIEQITGYRVTCPRCPRTFEDVSDAAQGQFIDELLEQGWKNHNGIWLCPSCKGCAGP